MSGSDFTTNLQAVENECRGGCDGNDGDDITRSMADVVVRVVR
jgi:hypothetical protein